MIRWIGVLLFALVLLNACGKEKDETPETLRKSISGTTGYLSVSNHVLAC